MGVNSLIQSTTTTNIPPTSPIKDEVWLDFCNLTDIDPWDSTIIEFVKPQKDHMINCTPKIFEHSKLINGQLYLYSNESTNDEEMGCEMRCLFVVDSKRINYGNRIKVVNGTKPECDVIEIQCQKNGSIYYRFWHAHVYRKVPFPSIPKQPEKFDVHLFVLDSVGHTHFIRSMPKTIHMLREHYGAIPFSHLNKVGRNSHPNGFAFLIGKMVENIPLSPFSKGHKAQYSSSERACRTPLDNEQFIGFRYKDDGYITMLAEDWAGGVLNYPWYCVGFRKPHVDHSMKPFQIHSERNKNDAEYMNGALYKESCHEPHPYLCDYLKSFLKAYPDKPKFSLSWLSTLQHNDDPNALSSSDDYFYHFFNDTKNDFENAFLFVMGDHGMRGGKIRETKVGEHEDNNPALFLSVPKPLRYNATFMDQIRKNAKELITHFDIYATLNDLVQPENPRIPDPLILGSSLLHPLPYPRTCDSLRIPFEFCICRTNKILLPENNTISIPATKLMIEQMNFNLLNSRETSKVCSKLFLNEKEKIIVEDYGGEQSVKVYKITFSTVPGNGKFWGIISFEPSNSSFRIISSLFSRMDQYAAQAKCANKSKFESYCYCNDLIGKKS
uniref:Uncharacterized protein n=1 Tax=Panagrolaimus sp. PS1159 TaxID=55785 RepID=A0AC35F1P2_9BILA